MQQTFLKWLTGSLEILQRREKLCGSAHQCSLSLAHPGPLLNHLQSVLCMISAVFTWWSSSWTCPCWRWRRGALSCWAGVGVSWRGGGRGWAYWQAGVCSCKPEPQYGKHCGCSSLMWRLSTPGKPVLRAAWPRTNPTVLRKKYTRVKLSTSKSRLKQRGISTSTQSRQETET